MRFKTTWSADGTRVQLKISADNDQESQVLLDLYNIGGLLALGKDKKERNELILGTLPAPRRR